MGIRTRRARRRSRTHIVGFGIAGIFGFIALFIIALSFSMGALVADWLSDLPDYSSADAYLTSERTTVYAADNSVIGEYYIQNRQSVDNDEISDYVLKGIVDTEDIRFYQHNGVDPQGILRAVYVQISGGSEGASTITQQLVRNTVLSDEQFDMTIRRKVREAYIAIQMEKMYTKDQILTMYLNTIYFGHNAYGIEAASITYFNKHAKDLTLAEAAVLCGLPQSPSGYDPLQNPEAAVARRNIVLQRMLTAGDISQEDYDKAVSEPLVTNEGVLSDTTDRYPFFSDYVKSLLTSSIDQKTISKGGLKVYTTLDPKMQDAAEEAVTDQLKSLKNDKLQAAMVAIDPNTGYVKAMVGGKDYSQSQYNLATQAKRQVGSSFKTFTLVDAISQGMNPGIYINCNSPMQFTSTWKVQNFANESMGTITMARAFARSSNTGFVQIAQAVGTDTIISTAQSMGISQPMENYDSLTLGTTGIPVIEMADAYSTIAANGVHRNQVAITKIEDRNGNTVYEHQDSPSQVISPAVAQASREVMEGVCQGDGTAGVLQRLMTVNQPVAGKTGTSENYRDLWFCGFTPQIAVAVWCGNDSESPVKIGGSYGHPYNTSVPIFAKFVNTALKDEEKGSFPTTEDKVNYKANSEWTFSKTDKSTSSTKHNFTPGESGTSSSSNSSKKRTTSSKKTNTTQNTNGTDASTESTGTGTSNGNSTGTTGGTSSSNKSTGGSSASKSTGSTSARSTTNTGSQ